MKSSPGLTASGSSPLDGNSPSPNVTPKSAARHPPLDLSSLPAASTLPTDVLRKPEANPAPRPANGEPPAKRKRPTPEEKAAKLKADEARKQDREAKKAKKVEEDKKKEEEARKKREEREKKRLEREEADKLKAEQKAKKEAEKKQQLEEREKKARSQLTLTAMFSKAGPPTPKKEQPIKTESVEDGSAAGTPSKHTAKNVSEYEALFKPFFVKENVKLANYPHEFDEETREAKSRIVSEYVEGKREGALLPLSDNPLEVLQIPYRCRRGRVYPSVRKIMAEYHGSSSSMPVDLTTESQNTQTRHTLEALRAVPVKSFKFREDVRPPYVGTISGLPPGVTSLRKIAVHPTARSVPSLNYDYDSEAEWQEEDGEDVEDLDDEEDDAENDEDMEDFLDDSEDVGPSRLVFSGGMEPESTGLCWENRKRLTSPAKVYKFRMEFILGGFSNDISR